MGQMVLVYSFNAPGATAELIGPNIIYWELGNEVFNGSIDDFAVQFPKQMAELLENNIVKKV